MTLDEAVELALDRLKSKGFASNSSILELIGGDVSLLEGVREELIVGDEARDKKGKGLGGIL